MSGLISPNTPIIKFAWITLQHIFFHHQWGKKGCLGEIFKHNKMSIVTIVYFLSGMLMHKLHHTQPDKQFFMWLKLPLIIDWCIKFTLYYITFHYTGNYCTVGVRQFYDYLTLENRIPFKLKFHQWREMVQLIHTLNLKIKNWKVNRYICSFKQKMSNPIKMQRKAKMKLTSLKKFLTSLILFSLR